MEYKKVKSKDLQNIQSNAGIIVKDFNPATGEAGAILGATTGEFASNRNETEDVDKSPPNREISCDMKQPTEAERAEIQRILREHYVDSDGRVRIRSVNDGTLIFLYEIYWLLKDAGCTDIQTVASPAEEREVPEDKPWCSYYFEASGILPEVDREK